jgi:EAL domain-containing protein (putative c-di-GMP-specific phosphodiesterase class I)
MYDAKDAGRNRSSVFQPLMRSRATERLTLQADLQYAVPDNQLRLYYQPTVELDTLRIVGLEALLRWDHPERGLIPPSEFISLAEETGLIVPIGRWVLFEACRQVAYWQRTIDGCEELGVAINVSGRQLQAREAVSDISDAIDAASLDPAAVTIEITESLFLTDTEAVRNQMQALKQLGVRLAIDDFGTGYSSLSYLSRFPLDVMKIDKSFLVDVCSSADRHAFLRSIIDMGHTLHLSTLGEGIENDRELELLRACGCDLGQGFLFARPLTPDQATEHLTAEATARRVTAA